MIITVGDEWENWELSIDTDELVKTTGARVYYADPDTGRRYYETATKQREARRILKFMLPYMTDLQRARLDDEFRANLVLMKIWEDLKK